MLLLLFIYLIYVSKTHFQIVTEPEKFYIEGTIIICFWIAVIFDTRESIQPVKVEWQGAGMVVCVECGADCLYVVPSMSLPSTTPSFLASLKSRILLPFWYWLTQVVLEKRPRNGVTCSVPVLGPAVLSGPQVVGSEKFMVSEELQFVEQSFLPMQRYAHVLWRNFLSLNVLST